MSTFYMNKTDGRSELFKAYTATDATVFPALLLGPAYENAEGVKTRYIIKRANFGMPGYYCSMASCKDGRILSSHYVDGYLPGDWEKPEDHVNWKELPAPAVKRVIRSYLLIALANLFSHKGWKFRHRTYNNESLPAGLLLAVEEFVNMDYEALMKE